MQEHNPLRGGRASDDKRGRKGQFLTCGLPAAPSLIGSLALLINWLFKRPASRAFTLGRHGTGWSW